MKRARETYAGERKLEAPLLYEGFKKQYAGDVNVLVLVWTTPAPSKFIPPRVRRPTAKNFFKPVSPTKCSR